MWRRGVAQLGSAPALGAGDRGFKSRRPDSAHTVIVRAFCHIGECEGCARGCLGRAKGLGSGQKEVESDAFRPRRVWGADTEKRLS